MKSKNHYLYRPICYILLVNLPFLKLLFVPLLHLDPDLHIGLNTGRGVL